jgi:hypothetical protein
MNRDHVVINWKFTRKKARQKFGTKEQIQVVRDLALLGVQDASTHRHLTGLTLV